MLLAIATGLAACASLPPARDGAPHRALPSPSTPSTRLAAMTAAALPADGRSGFLLQPYGPNSFATRMALIRARAKRASTSQYYLLPGDNTGRALMRGLARCRGARRARTAAAGRPLHRRAKTICCWRWPAIPNVEVRLFNPFPGGRASTELTRFISSGLDFDRVNRRMHNKLFIADNAAAVAGGRNMADEYVMNASGSNFVDMDTFAAGPVVRALSDASSTTTGTARWCFRCERIASAARCRASPAAGRTSSSRTAEARPPAAGPHRRRTARSPNPAPGRARRCWRPTWCRCSTCPFELADGHRLPPLLWAQSPRVLYDPLTKTEGWNESRESLEGHGHRGHHPVVQHRPPRNIKMVSPYFIPSDAGPSPPWSIARQARRGHRRS